MNGDHFIQDYIDLYMRGGVSDKEFQERLKNDPVLQKALDAANEDPKLIKQLPKQDSKSIAESEFKELKKLNEKPKSLISIKRISATAVAAIILLLFYFTYNNLYQAIDHNELFIEYFEVPPPSSPTSSLGPTGSWYRIIENYSNGEFKSVIKDLPPLLEDPGFGSVEIAKLYLAISYLMENQYRDAKIWLQQVSPKSTIIQDAEWYLALTYLKGGEIDAARATLNSIIGNPRHYKQKEALSLLDKI